MKYSDLKPALLYKVGDIIEFIKDSGNVGYRVVKIWKVEKSSLFRTGEIRANIIRTVDSRGNIITHPRKGRDLFKAQLVSKDTRLHDVQGISYEI